MLRSDARLDSFVTCKARRAAPRLLNEILHTATVASIDCIKVTQSPLAADANFEMRKGGQELWGPSADEDERLKPHSVQ